MRAERWVPFSGVGVLVIAFFGLGLSGCLQTEGQRKAELEERASEIIPAGAHVRSLGYGDCVELTSSPSCAEAVFEMAQPDSADRALLLRTTASSHGWTVTNSDDAQGGWSVSLEHDGFSAVAFLWRPEAYNADCREPLDPASEPDKFCFNSVSVTRQ
jgi:hypothetical protein